MKTGSELIAIERERQVKVEGWDTDHDDEFTDGELALAAICYATPQPIFIRDDRARAVIFEDPWPWEDKWDRRYTRESGNALPDPNIYTQLERVAFLIKAGALIAAEIDRIQRLSNHQVGGSNGKIETLARS